MEDWQLSGKPLLQGCAEGFGRNRLGDKAVHPRVEAALPIGLQHVGGHGDYGDCVVDDLRVLVADAEVASMSPMTGMRMSISTRS